MVPVVVARQGTDHEPVPPRAARQVVSSKSRFDPDMAEKRRTGRLVGPGHPVDPGVETFIGKRSHPERQRLRLEPEPFHLVHFLAIASCLELVQPEAVHLHCAHPPTGPWWDRIADRAGRGNRSFAALHYYDDELTYALVDAACDELGTPREGEGVTCTVRLPAAVREGSTPATTASAPSPGTLGATFVHVFPSSRVTCRLPSSVPAQITPRCTGDSASEYTVP